MFGTTDIALLVATGLLLNITPGPDTLQGISVHDDAKGVNLDWRCVLTGAVERSGT